jgi:UDPglucose 6-dehydrogenase
VGLVAGAGFASFGNDVICADINESIIERLERGEIPIFEPGLDRLVARNVREGRLHFTTDVEQAVSDVDVVFIAVGTPPREDGSADLSYVWDVARTVGRNATGFTVVVDKSTVPVGTANEVLRILEQEGPDKDFAVVSNPEFLKEGDAVADFLKPERVIIGTDDQRALRIMRQLYTPFLRATECFVEMDTLSAEVTKYACNAMLATRVSFMNEMARLCHRVGADISKVRIGMAMDNRIGSRFLFPGVGYGGSCFPKDVKAIIATGLESGLEMEILKAVEGVNRTQKQLLANKTIEYFKGDLSGRTVAFWGLAFKPRTDDVREAPAKTIADILLQAGAELQVHDPEALETFKELLPPSDRVRYCDNNYDAVQGADALLLITEWAVYQTPDFRRIKELMKHPVLFDGRNIWDPEYVRSLGFHYTCIGRP